MEALVNKAVKYVVVGLRQRDMRNEGTHHGTLEKELMVKGKPVEFGKEMEVLHARPALLDKKANLRLLSCCAPGSMTTVPNVPAGKKDAWDQTLMHRGWLERQHPT